MGIYTICRGENEGVRTVWERDRGESVSVLYLALNERMKRHLRTTATL